MENIYNWDEKGFMLGISHSTKRVMSKEAYISGQRTQAAQDGSREFITLLACICADGTYIPPALIYQGTSHDLLDTWMDDLQEGDECYFGSSENGWSSNEFGLEWLQKVFNRHTKEKSGQGRRLLIVDGHSSHVNISFLDWADQERIIILVLPPHSTHRLQPLDVAMFLPLSIYYSQELQTLMSKGLGLIRMSKRMFYSLFKLAWDKAFIKENIDSAFTKTGIWPFNVTLVIDVIRIHAITPPIYELGELKTPKTSKAIRKFQREFRLDPTNEKRDKLFKANEQLSTEVAILKSRAQGLEDVIKRKGEKKRGKPLNLIGEESNGCAQLFSPARIHKAREYQTAQDQLKEDEKEAIITRRTTAIEKKRVEMQVKEDRRIQKGIEKAMKEEEKTAEAIRKALNKVQLSEQRAQKKEEERASIESRKRIREELNAPHQSPVKKRSKRKAIGSIEGNIEVGTDIEVKAATTERGRHIVLPERFRR